MGLFQRGSINQNKQIKSKSMEVVLTFINISGKQIVMRKTFTDESHLTNFINYATRRYNYVFDEVWHQN